MTHEFIIIGAGVAGCATALELATQGARVSIIEQGGVGLESSWAGGGILYPLLPWDYTEAVNQLVQRSIALFPFWAEKLQAASGIDPEFQRCGMLVLPPFSQNSAQTWCDAHGTLLERGARKG